MRKAWLLCHYWGAFCQGCVINSPGSPKDDFLAYDTCECISANMYEALVIYNFCPSATDARPVSASLPMCMNRW